MPVEERLEALTAKEAAPFPWPRGQGARGGRSSPSRILSCSSSSSRRGRGAPIEGRLPTKETAPSHLPRGQGARGSRSSSSWILSCWSLSQSSLAPADPPCEQWLTAVGAGAAILRTSPHTPSPPLGLLPLNSPPVLVFLLPTL
jgi:hypothetical protein